MHTLSEFNLARLGSLTDLVTRETKGPDEIRSLVQARQTDFLNMGLRPGDCAILLHGNCIAFFIDLLAVLKIGGCAIPLDASSSPQEVQNIVRHAHAVVVLPGDSPKHDLPPKPLAAAGFILYTSGTTGSPKGVFHPLANLVAQFALWKTHIPLAHLERTLCFLPTHLGHGLFANSLFPLLEGQHLFLLPAFELNTLTMLGKTIEDHSITFLSSVPSVWRIVLPLSSPPPAGILRRIHCASAPLTADTWREIRQWAPGAEVRNVYGLTETASWISAAAMENTEDGYVGRGWNAEFSIRDSCGLSIPINKAGHVWIRSPSMMSGYFRRDDLTAQVLRDGWLASGDIGRLDAHGGLTLLGRAKELINKAGMKIYPEDLDHLLSRAPGVREACVFSMQDAIAGETVAAAIVFANSNEHMSFDELEDWCRARTARFKVPSAWFELPRLPKTSGGKINRAEVSRACRRERPQ